jgi:hypothetical protein
LPHSETEYPDQDSDPERPVRSRECEASNDGTGNDLRSEGGEPYPSLTALSPELARIIEAWDELPLHIRTSIIALVDAASTGR